MSDLKLTWDDLRERARKHDGLSDDKKCEAVLAFDILQGLFGSSFFDRQHPLFWFFLDRSAWRCKWAIWFADFLQTLKQHPDFSPLVRDLKNASSFGERMSVLNIAEILTRGGFLFRLDADTNIGAVKKKPDLFVQLDSHDPGLFIEVSTLAPHQRQQEADKMFQEMWKCFLPYTLSECSGRLLRVLAPPHLEEIKEKIRMTINKAVDETGFESLEIAGVIQFAFATEPNKARLESWARVRGMKAGEFIGPPINIPEFDRISFKLKKKLEQVPHERSNVVVVYSHFFASPPTDTATFAEFVHGIEDEVYKHPHIGYFILILSCWGGCSQILRYKDHICVNRDRFHFESMMLFKNRFAAKPMPVPVEKSFLKAFIRAVETN